MAGEVLIILAWGNKLDRALFLDIHKRNKATRSGIVVVKGGRD
jgi:hypothetical protein